MLKIGLTGRKLQQFEFHVINISPLGSLYLVERSIIYPWSNYRGICPIILWNVLRDNDPSAWIYVYNMKHKLL